MYRAYVEQTQSEKIYLELSTKEKFVNISTVIANRSDIFRCLEVILTKLTTLPFF